MIIISPALLAPIIIVNNHDLPFSFMYVCGYYISLANVTPFVLVNMYKTDNVCVLAGSRIDAGSFTNEGNIPIG